MSTNNLLISGLSSRTNRSMSTSSSGIMENSWSETEEMSFDEKIYQDLSRDGPSLSQRHTFGRGLSVGRGASAFPRHKLVILSLGLLDAVLLIAAAVIGIYCAKAKDLRMLDSAATPQLLKMNFLRNHSDVIKAKTEAQEALEKERQNHVQLKLQVMQKKAITDILQGKIEILQTEKINIQKNKTTLENNCGRCQPEWVFLKSSCYYFSHHQPEGRNWSSSRADCVSRGGDLLVINNFEEQQLVNDNIPKQSYSGVWWQRGFWLGLTALSGKWTWINNVTDATTLFWRIGQPTQPPFGNCSAFLHSNDVTKTFYSGDCTRLKLNWICEMEPQKV
ncbi:C-type lectin domain family 4 member G-like isoform 1-T1 [Menidia menidia]